MKILAASVLALCLAGFLHADDRFALAIGEHCDICVFGPHGEKAADLAAPAIAQPVVIQGGPSFQMSFGRDVNDQFTAILSPDAAHPADLHFTVLNKHVDADHGAVVTLTFSKSLNRVTIDPGYMGVVHVNAEALPHHAMTKTPAATSEKAEKKTASAPVEKPMTEKKVVESKAKTHDLPPASSSNGAGVVQPVSDSTTPLTPVSASSDSLPDTSKATTVTMAKRRLFWAEPVSTVNAIKVGSNEMKLLAVHGKVTVKTPDGQTEPGTNGLLVPTGSTVQTGEKSSAAVLMGGVDSARLVPSSSVTVNQTMEGDVRHTKLDLQKGSVFSRVGKRPGETQKYEVGTPEGVAAARGTEYLDVLVDGVHVVFVNKGTVDLFINGQLVGTVTGGKSDIGMGSIPPGKMTRKEMQRILNEVLTEMQPYNVTTIQALFDYSSGKATQAEIDLIQEELYGSLISDGATANRDTFFASQIGSAVAAAVHDLLPNQNTVNAFQTTADEPTSGNQPTE